MCRILLMCIVPMFSCNVYFNLIFKKIKTPVNNDIILSKYTYFFTVLFKGWL